MGCFNTSNNVNNNIKNNNNTINSKVKDSINNEITGKIKDIINGVDNVVNRLMVGKQSSIKQKQFGIYSNEDNEYPDIDFITNNKPIRGYYSTMNVSDCKSYGQIVLDYHDWEWKEQMFLIEKNKDNVVYSHDSNGLNVSVSM